MIDAEAADAIIEQYQKHGWILRRALLSAEGKQMLADKIGSGVSIVDSDVDAFWFSRQSNPKTEAWELRRLTGLPFALIAVLSTDADAEEIESTLDQVVDELREKTMA